MKNFSSKLKIFSFLLVFWFLFTSEFSIMNLLSGIIISSIVTKISFTTIYNNYKTKIEIPNIISLIRYFFRLILEIYKASFIQVFRIIKNQSDPEIVEVTLSTNNNLIITLIANSITLTPGTTSVHVEDNKLYVLSIMLKDQNHDLFQNNIKKTFEKYFI